MARGDHIRVRRWRGVYFHHGIDMGDGTVIHLSGEPFRSRHAAVCRTDMAEFLQGERMHVVPYPRGCRPVEEVVASAEAALSQSGYCLCWNNCEHFASACKTGKARSRQVARAIWAGSTVAGAACVTVVAIAAAIRRKNSATGTS